MVSLEYSGWMSFPSIRRYKFSFFLFPTLSYSVYLLTCFHINSPFSYNLCCRFCIQLHWWIQNEKKLGGLCPFLPFSASSTFLLPMSKISQLLLIHQLSHLWNYGIAAWTVSRSPQLLQDMPNDKGRESGVWRNPPKDSSREEGTAGCNAHIQVMSESRSRTVLWTQGTENMGWFWDLPGEQNITGEHRMYRHTGTTGIIGVWVMIHRKQGFISSALIK